MSFFVMGPIPTLTMLIWFCLSKTIRASRLPSESAFITIPVLSVLISSDISSLNSSDISSNVFFSEITLKGIPGRISSLEIIWSFIPVAASTLSVVLNPLFKGRASCMVRILVLTVFSKDAIAISSVIFRLPS